MYSVYHLKASELDDKFTESLKTLFGNKSIEIVVSEVDETEYLLSSEANKQRLMDAIDHVEQGKYLVEVDLEELR